MQKTSYVHYGDPRGMTYGVQMLLVANIAAALIDWLIFPLKPFFQLSAQWWSHFGVWELITYQFLHQGPMHLFANMLGLFFLGPEVERGVGTNRFFILYFLSGILGGLGWSLISPPWHNCVGASGSVFGVLGAFAALHPNRELYVWGLIPVRAWILILILGIYELSHILDGPGGAVANAAHLGGGVAGYFYATVIARPNLLQKIGRKMNMRSAPGSVSQSEIDRILDKAAAKGMHSLTRDEREKLKRAGRR